MSEQCEYPGSKIGLQRIVDRLAARSGLKRLALVAVGALMVALVIVWFGRQGSAPLVYEHRDLRYAVVVANPGSTVQKAVVLQAAIPLDDGASQKRAKLETSATHEVTKDQFDNDVAEIRFVLPPYAEKTIYFTTSVEVSNLKPMVETTGDAYLRPSTLIQSGHEAILNQAEKLRVQGDEMASLRNTYDWVRKHMTYEGYVAEDRGAQYAMEQGRGDCSEYAYLTAALLRAMGIPARVHAGFVYDKSARVSIKDYHNWVEALVGEHWWVVDTQKELLSQSSSSYISFRIVDGEKGNSQSFISTDSPVAVRVM